MKQSTIRTFELSTDQCPAVYFCSVSSNFDKPEFRVELGYSSSDGDSWILDREQLVSLKTMIDEHLDASKGVDIEGSYRNRFDYMKEPYPPIGEGSFNVEECFEGCKACTDVVEDAPGISQDWTLKEPGDLTVKDYQKARKEGTVLPIIDKNGILDSPKPFKPNDSDPV